jgi:hypothetical protein
MLLYQSHTRSDKEIFGQDEAALSLSGRSSPLWVVELNIVRSHCGQVSYCRVQSVSYCNTDVKKSTPN